MALNPYEDRTGRLHRLAEMTRREFLIIVGAMAGLGALVFGGLETLKFMFPNATLEQPPQYKTNYGPEDLSPSAPVISITSARISLVLDNLGIYAVYLVCTHLGCTPNYASDVVSGSGVSTATAESHGFRGPTDLRPGARPVPKTPNGWACPCHGSRYFIDSTNFYGPAPRPMDWVEVSVTQDGKLLVDRAKLVAYRQAGQTTPPEWRLVKGSDGRWTANGRTIGV